MFNGGNKKLLRLGIINLRSCTETQSRIERKRKRIGKIKQVDIYVCKLESFELYVLNVYLH